MKNRDQLLKDLQKELRANISWPDAVSEADLARLLVQVKDAKTRQAADLRRAVDQGMSYVPVLLRGALRRILFP